LRRIGDGYAVVGGAACAGIEKEGAARREVTGDHALDLLARAIRRVVRVKTPARGIEITVCPRRGIGRIGIDAGRDGPELLLHQAVQRAGGLQHPIHERAQTAHKHLLELGAVVGDVVQQRFQSARVKENGGGQGVIEITQRIAPVVPVRQVHVPHDRLPVARAVGVAVETIVFLADVGVAVEQARHAIVDERGHIDVVVGENQTLMERE